MSERPSLKAHISQLQAENAALRALLEAQNHTSTDDNIGLAAGDQIDLPEVQLRRDKIAVGALLLRHMDVYAALKHLGYSVATMSREEQYATAKSVFDNDRIRELLDETLRPAEEEKDALIKRQIQIALYGGDKCSTYAMQLVAKVCSWYPGQTPDPRTAGIDFKRIPKSQPPAPASSPLNALDALDAFTHEPAESSHDAINDIVDEDWAPAYDAPSNPPQRKLPWPEHFGGYPRSAQSETGTS